MSNRHDYGMEGDGKDLFITMDGKRIAKRGHPRSRHARTWVSLEPGIVVRDVPGEQAIEVEVNGVRVH